LDVKRAIARTITGKSLEELQRIIQKVARATTEGVAGCMKKQTPQKESITGVKRTRCNCERCENCGADSDGFVEDRHAGDIICSRCGVVACERILDESPAFRTFEGESDRNHHGPKWNPHLSASKNLACSFSRIAGSGVSASYLKALCRAQRMSDEDFESSQSVLLHSKSKLLSNGKRKTRVNYKDNQKLRAFNDLSKLAANHDLAQPVLAQAKANFSAYRDRREQVCDYQGVVAACLLLALDQQQHQQPQCQHRHNGSKSGTFYRCSHQHTYSVSLLPPKTQICVS